MWQKNENDLLEKKPLLVLFEKMVGFAPETRNHTDQILENVSTPGFYINCDTDDGITG